ncbi:MAG: hypothetical protein WB116_07450, partial [Candidatus Dormiibacterota bacterium]
MKSFVRRLAGARGTDSTSGRAPAAPDEGERSGGGSASFTVLPGERLSGAGTGRGDTPDTGQGGQSGV